MGFSDRLALGISSRRRIVSDWIIAALVSLLAAVLAAQPAAASTWTGSAGNGLWNTSGNWSGGVPNVTGAVADFSTLDITADNTVHMNGAEAVGTLLFGDNMTPSNNWILDNNNGGGNVLTLAVSSGSPTVTVNNDTATISAVVAGSQGLTKNGAGTLVLSGNDTYSGTTAISVGTLVLGSVNALGSTAAGTTFTSGATLDLGGQAVGSESLTISGTGVGGDGALVNSSTTAASLSGTVGASAAFTVGGTGDITLSGSVNSLPANVLTKIGNNTLALSGTTDNSNLGATVNSGTLVLGKTSSHSPDVHAIGQATLTVAGGVAQLGGTGGDQIYDLGTVAVTSGAFDSNGQSETFAALSLHGTGIGNTGALVNSAAALSTITPTNGTTLTGDTTIGVTQSGGRLTLKNAIGGNFGITKVGAGELVLEFNGNNTFSGGLTVAQGELFFSASSLNNANTNGSLGNNASVTLGSSGQTGILGGFGTSNMPFVLATGGTGEFDLDGSTLSGVISGSGGLVVANSSNAAITLTGNSTFTGGLAVLVGGLAVPVVNNVHTNGPLGNNASVTLGGNSGLNGFDQRLEYTGVSAASNMPFTIGAGGGEFFVDGATVNLTLSGGIAGSGVLTKLGPGTLTLSGNNTLGAGITVASGTLSTAASGSIGPGPLTITPRSNAVTAVNIGGSQTVNSLSATSPFSVVPTLSIGSGATLTVDQSFGDTSFLATLINSGTLAKLGISSLEINTAPTLNANSALMINGGKLRFNYLSSGTPTIGTGVTATVGSGGTLELAGSISALSSATNRVNVINNSSPAGLLVTGTQQQVGNIEGSGSTQVNIGGSLTSNHIIQSALAIGGTSSKHGLVIIAASDASGNSLDLADSELLDQPSGIDSNGFLSLDGKTGFGEISSADLGNSTIDTSSSPSTGSGQAPSTGSGRAVPEPSTLLLALLAVSGVAVTPFARHHFRCQTIGSGRTDEVTPMIG